MVFLFMIVFLTMDNRQRTTDNGQWIQVFSFFKFSIFNFQFSISIPCFQVPLGDLEAVVVAAYIFYTVALKLGDALGV